MIKKNFTLILSILLTVVLTSCGNSSKNDKKQSGDFKLDVDPKISGSFSESYKVNNAVLKISEKSFGTKLLVEIERTDADLPLNPNDAQVCGVGAGKTFEWCMSADILGDNDLPIDTNLDKYGYDPFEKALSLKSGEKVWLEFSLGYNSDLEEEPTKAKKVKLTSSLEERDLSEITSNSSNNDENDGMDEEVASSSNDSDKVDKALDSYEAYVDQYIKFLKKAQKGDNSAMAEYPSLMQKATDMQEKMDDMKDDFSAKQMGRMMKIQTKMTNAAIEMQ